MARPASHKFPNSRHVSFAASFSPKNLDFLRFGIVTLAEAVLYCPPTSFSWLSASRAVGTCGVRIGVYIFMMACFDNKLLLIFMNFMARIALTPSEIQNNSPTPYLLASALRPDPLLAVVVLEPTATVAARATRGSGVSSSPSS